MPVRILVVDDEPDLHLLFRQKFKRQDEWAFVFAGDGVEALDLVQNSPAIDLVLTDINMPRMDGLTLLERLREHDPLLRVVIVSAYTDMANIRTAMNRGAYDFVTKPINLDDLETTIRKTWEEVRTSREAEAALRELAVARQVQEAKARFFADLSHEFRTPLTLILGPLHDALQSGALREDDVPVMHRHALRLKRLIDQLLDLSKLEAGRMTLRAAQHDLIPFLADLVLAFAQAAERKHITLRFEPPAGNEPLNLYFEADKLEKVVANLLSNALKFTPEGGHVKVACRQVQNHDRKAIEILVRDNGPGIALEALPHLFDRFYQANPSDSAAGTGIGLALAKELVELHYGTIEVESEVGFGTTFRVRLPLGTEHLRPGDLAEAESMGVWGYGSVEECDEVEDEATSIPPHPHTPTSQSTVLVAEDHPDVRAYLRRHLRTRYHVIEAEDGAAALAKAREVKPDLVISDVMMPEMDGFDLCRALKADAALNHIPVILITARAGDEDLLEGLEQGADAYLPKPFNAEELLQRAENLIEVRRLLRARFSDEVVLKPTDIAVPSADAAFLERVQHYIEQHMGDRTFDVASVADAVGVSPRQLRRKIRDLTGLSPSGFAARSATSPASPRPASSARTASSAPRNSSTEKPAPSPRSRTK